MKSSSIKSIFVSNFISQLISALVGIVILPFYSAYFNAADYGVFMIFYLSFSWILILDLGFTNYLNKNATLFRNGKINENMFVRILRTYELLFLGVLLLISLTYFLLLALDYDFNGLLHKNWIILVFLAAFIKLFTMLYKSSLDGFYKGNIASLTSMIFLIIRYIIPLIITLKVPFTISTFLSFQLIISIIEAFTLIFSVKKHGNLKLRFFGFESKHVFNSFTFYSMLTTFMYVSITQFDKISMLKVLSIVDYGHFAAIIAITNGIFYLSGPFMATISPRIIGLIAAGKNLAAQRVINGSFEVSSTIILGLSFLIGVNGMLILKILQPSLISSTENTMVFFLYIVGNGIFSLIGYLNLPQIALGNLKYNLIINVFNMITTILGVLIIGRFYGIIGIAAFWMIRNTLITTLSFVFYHRFNKCINFSKQSKALLSRVFMFSILAAPFIFLTKNTNSLMVLLIYGVLSAVIYTFACIIFSKQISLKLNSILKKKIFPIRISSF